MGLIYVVQRIIISIFQAGLSALHIAASSGQCAKLGRLLVQNTKHSCRPVSVDMGCKKEYPDGDGNRTALHYAAHYKGRSAVESFAKLVELGADIDKRSVIRCRGGQQGWPALLYAVEVDNKPIVRWYRHSILSKGFIFWWWASHSAAIINNACKLDWSRYRGLDRWILQHYRQQKILRLPRVEGNRTASMVASLQGHTTMLKIIAELYSEDLYIKDDYGRTCLHYAASKGHDETVRALVEDHGFQDDSKDRWGKACVSYWVIPGQSISVSSTRARCKTWSCLVLIVE